MLPRTLSILLTILISNVCTRVILLDCHLTIKTSIEFSRSFPHLINWCLAVTLNTLGNLLEWLEGRLVTLLVHLMLLVGQINNLVSNVGTLHFLLVSAEWVTLLAHCRLVQWSLLTTLKLSKTSVVLVLFLPGNWWTRLCLSRWLGLFIHYMLLQSSLFRVKSFSLLSLLQLILFFLVFYCILLLEIVLDSQGNFKLLYVEVLGKLYIENILRIENLDPFRNDLCQVLDHIVYLLCKNKWWVMSAIELTYLLKWNDRCFTEHWVTFAWPLRISRWNLERTRKVVWFTRSIWCESQYSSWFHFSSDPQLLFLWLPYPSALSFWQLPMFFDQLQFWCSISCSFWLPHQTNHSAANFLRLTSLPPCYCLLLYHSSSTICWPLQLLRESFPWCHSFGQSPEWSLCL